MSFPWSKRTFSPAFIAVAISVVSFLVFLPALHNGFVGWDDGTNLVKNPYFRGLGWAQLKWMWTNHLMEHYVPLTWMTYGLDYVLWKQRSYGYHLTNILLHAVNAGLFFWLALELLKLARPAQPGRSRTPLLWGAGFAALIFSLHPLRVESVAWATERRDVLSGCFYLLALLAYLRRFTSEPGPRADRKYYWWCFALFAAAVLSKEITVTLPVVLLILDVYPLRRLGGAAGEWFGPPAWRVWIEKVPFLVLSIADGIMTMVVSARHHGVDTIHAMGWLPRVTITIYGMAFYILKTIAPVHLAPLYPLTRYKTYVWAAPFLMSAAVVLAISIVAVALWRRFPAVLAVWVVYTVTLLPVGGLVHNGYQIAADRYTYLACMGWALLLGVGLTVCWDAALSRSPALRVLLAGVAALLLVALGWRTRAQIPIWHDTETLWSQAIAVEPSALALNSLGAAYVAEGDTLGGLDLYRRAIALDPSYALAHNNLGAVYMDLHRYDESIHEFRIAQKLVPDMVEAYDGSGNALRMAGRLDEAIEDYRHALQLRADYTMARLNLEKALAVKQSLSQR
jgi:hypothetical protein